MSQTTASRSSSGTSEHRPVRQGLGQHGHDAIRQIEAVAAFPGVPVQRRAGLDVVGDIGNRHHQPPAVPLGLREHGVVEIAGVGTVDGHQWQIAKITASLHRARVHS